MVELSQNQAADVLGKSRRTYQMMERQKEQITGAVPLACAAYALGLRGYDAEYIMASVAHRNEQRRKGRKRA